MKTAARRVLSMQGSRKGVHRDLLRSFSLLRGVDPLVTELPR